MSESGAGEREALRGGLPNPSCPDCRRPMSLKLVTPIMFASGLDDLTYVCEACGKKIKRTEPLSQG